MRKRTVALLILTIAAIGFFILGNPTITGFFAMPSVQNQPVLYSNNGTSENNGLNAMLSIEVLKNSELSAELFLQQNIPDCPETADANILVKNTGNWKVEMIKIKISPDLKAIACANCTIESLGIGESKTVSLKLCNASGKNHAISVSSANSDLIELKIPEK